MKKRKSEKKKIEEVGTASEILIDKVCVVLGVVCFLCFFFLLTLYITTKNKEDSTSTNNDNTKAEAVISYDEIIVGRSFSMREEDYLVMYYDRTDTDIGSTYSNLINEYNQKDDHMYVYTVDMGNSFNSPYATVGESNKTPATVSDIKVNGPTLMKISGGVVAEYIEGENAITEYLK